MVKDGIIIISMHSISSSFWFCKGAVVVISMSPLTQYHVFGGITKNKTKIIWTGYEIWASYPSPGAPEIFSQFQIVNLLLPKLLQNQEGVGVSPIHHPLRHIKMTGSPGQTWSLMWIDMTLCWEQICRLIFFQIPVGIWWHWVSRGHYLLIL